MAVASDSGYIWKVLHLPLEFFSQRNAGDIMARGDADAPIAQRVVGQLAPLLINGAMLLVYLVLMVSYSPLLAAVGVVSCATATRSWSSIAAASSSGAVTTSSSRRTAPTRASSQRNRGGYGLARKPDRGARARRRGEARPGAACALRCGRRQAHCRPRLVHGALARRERLRRRRRRGDGGLHGARHGGPARERGGLRACHRGRGRGHRGAARHAARGRPLLPGAPGGRQGARDGAYRHVAQPSHPGGGHRAFVPVGRASRASSSTTPPNAPAGSTRSSRASRR